MVCHGGNRAVNGLIYGFKVIPLNVYNFPGGELFLIKI